MPLVLLRAPGTRGHAVGPAAQVGLAAGSLTRALVGFWPLAEGGGSTIFETQGAHPLGTASALAWVAGRPGQVATFNGTSSVITVPDCPAQSPSGGLSLSLWYTCAGGAGTFRQALAKQSGATWQQPYATYALRLSNANAWTFWVNDGGNAVDTLTSATSIAVASSTWRHVAATWDKSQLILYLDGVQDSQKSYSGTLSSSTFPLCLGADTAGTSPWNGGLAALGLWGRALLPAEVAALARAPFAPLRPLRTTPAGNAAGGAGGAGRPLASRRARLHSTY